MGKKGSGTAVNRKPVEDKPVIQEQPNAKQPTPERTPVVRKPSAPLRVLPTVNINVFAAVSGIKPDQLAGFYYYAKRNKLRQMTVPEWHEAYKAYLVLPVK